MDEQVQTKLMEYLSTIEKGVVDLAPKAYELALNLNHMHAVINLVQGLIILAVGWGLFGGLLKTFFWAAKKNEEDDFENAMIFSLTGTIVVAFFSIIYTFGFICDTPMWITLFNKELGLAYTIWEKFT